MYPCKYDFINSSNLKPPGDHSPGRVSKKPKVNVSQVLQLSNSKGRSIKSKSKRKKREGQRWKRSFLTVIGDLSEGTFSEVIISPSKEFKDVVKAGLLDRNNEASKSKSESAVVASVPRPCQKP
ncbi:hypothetical protein ACFX1X_013516 [Malus domestica]